METITLGESRNYICLVTDKFLYKVPIKNFSRGIEIIQTITESKNVIVDGLGLSNENFILLDRIYAMYIEGNP